MKITKSIPFEFYLNNQDISEITKLKLRQMLLPGQYIRRLEDILWVTKDEDNWRHGSISEDKVRKATELDLAIELVLNSIDTFDKNVAEMHKKLNGVK